MKIDFQKIIVGLSLALATFAVVKVNRVNNYALIHTNKNNFVNKTEFYRSILVERFRKYRYILNRPYDESKIDRTTKYPDRIWIFWDKGFENASLVVNKCVSSIKKHSCGRIVELVDANNLQKYIQLPDYIIQKYKDGIISPIQLSDIVRTELLYQHGGTYFDATTYVIDDPKEIFEAEEYFNTFANENNYNKLSFNLIPNYCLRFKQPKHYFCYVMRNFLFDYWKENDIDVSWQWYSFATIAWQEDPKVFRFVQRVLKQNSKSKAYQVWGTVLLNGYSQALYENIKKSGQKVFKLNKSNKISKQNIDNTVLGYLINSTQHQ